MAKRLDLSRIFYIILFGLLTLPLVLKYVWLNVWVTRYIFSLTPYSLSVRLRLARKSAALSLWTLMTIWLSMVRGSGEAEAISLSNAALSARLRILSNLPTNKKT